MTISWHLSKALRPPPLRRTVKKLQLLPSQPVGLQSFSLGNDSSHTGRIRLTPHSPTPPHPSQAHKSQSLLKTPKRRNGNLEDLGTLAVVNTDSIQRMTFWVSSCWRSREQKIFLNLATVRLFAATIVSTDLWWRAVTRTGWDMDPFVVISFGKKVFRTRIIRHSLNPSWDEKLIFHVRRYESKFEIQFSVLDWDKLSANDHIGDASLELAELISRAPQKDPNTDLYAAGEDGIHDLDPFTVQLVMPKDLGADPKYKPELTFRLGPFLCSFSLR